MRWLSWRENNRNVVVVYSFTIQGYLVSLQIDCLETKGGCRVDVGLVDEESM